MPDPRAFQASLQLLKVRDRSEAELAARLRRKGFPEAEVTDALARCRRLGYLDDQRFAEGRARALARQGRAVGPRAAADLRGRGIPEPIVQDALRLIAGEFDEKSLLADLCRRKYPGFRWTMAEDREKRRIVDFLRRRGFSTAMVLETLQHHED